MVPIKINLNLIRRIGYDEEQNQEMVTPNLDLVEEKGDDSQLSAPYVRRR